MYGIQKDSDKIDPSKGIMPKPVTALPKISADGGVVKPASYVIDAPEATLTAGGDSHTTDAAGPAPAALTPTDTKRLLYGRKSWT
jgi:penicillin-binding protein 2